MAAGKRVVGTRKGAVTLTKDGKPKNKRRRLTADARQGEILAAARRVFSRSGLEGARTRDIANEAKANIATIFHYYKSKDQLFEAAVLQPLEEFVDRQAERSKAFTNSPAGRRRSISDLSIETELRIMIDIFPLLSAALFSERKRNSKFYKERLYPSLQALARHAAKSVPHLKERGLTSEIVALVTFGMHFAVAMDAHYRSVDIDCHKTAQQISEFTLYGVEGEKRKR